MQPASLLLLMLPLSDHPLAAFVLFPGAGLFQAWMLWRIARGRRREPGTGAPV